MTRPQLEKRVKHWQDTLSVLGVGHFRIESINVNDESPSGSTNANASVWTSSHYDSVHFWFSTSVLHPDQAHLVDETIVHEWLHVAMRDYDEVLDIVESWMPPHTYSDFESTLQHEREGLVDRLARQIVLAYSV